MHELTCMMQAVLFGKTLWGLTGSGIMQIGLCIKCIACEPSFVSTILWLGQRAGLIMLVTLKHQN